MKFKVSIIYGSVRTDRLGIIAARYLEKKLKDRGVEVKLIDPLVHKLPFLDKMYKEFPKGEAPDELQRLADVLRESDGFLLVTGEYNHSIPPAMKNLLDHFQGEYHFKPSAIASYSAGPFGGVRAAVHLRVIAGELGMPAISSMLPLPGIGNLFNDDLSPKVEIVEKSTRRFLDEFIWYIEAFKSQRAKGLPY